ncbi:hypothetical protein Patl1_33095 [Pistacia atlantica]|uniref:Uncharacterized protein n=1 Tax=Pistacia atlantica TaxID=434234 RepID=A0ACC1ALW8_9ROSI|nr:hypothetical protein Patl1_33095 [Pistacia atlantica]
MSNLVPSITFILAVLWSSQEFASPDLETTPVVAKIDVAQATPPDNFTIDVSEYEDQNLAPEKDSGEEKCHIFTGDWKGGLIGLAVATVGLTSEAAYHLEVSLQAFRISFEQSPKKAKQDHDNGKTNGKAGESDVIDVEFEEFCKAIEANLSIEKMVEILEANDQDSCCPDPVVVTKCQDMLFYGSLGRCPIYNSKLEFDGKRYICKGMYSEWSTCTFRTKDPPRREEPVKIPDSVLKSVDLDVYFWTIHSCSLQLRLDFDLEVSNDSKMGEKLGFEEDKGRDNHNQNNTNNVENNNATIDSCGEDCVDAVIVEKAGECLSLFVIVAMNCCLMFRLDVDTTLMLFNFLASFDFLYVVGETKLEASKEGRTLKDFKCGCVGYSVYLDNKDSSTDKMDKEAELPFCVGLEVMYYDLFFLLFPTL